MLATNCRVGCVLSFIIAKIYFSERDNQSSSVPDYSSDSSEVVWVPNIVQYDYFDINNHEVEQTILDTDNDGIIDAFEDEEDGVVEDIVVESDEDEVEKVYLKTLRGKIQELYDRGNEKIFHMILVSGFILKNTGCL